MSFHWGHGIALTYSIFALVLIIAVIKSTAFDNSLVTENYYAEDIAYQSTIDRQQNSSALENPVLLRQEEEHYVLQFPLALLGSGMSGKIQLYCPVSNSRDRIWPLRPDADGRQLLPLADLQAGHYRIIVKWTDGKKAFLDEFPLHIKA